MFKSSQVKSSQVKSSQVKSSQITFLTKEQSLYIKGCAIILMFIHHLFPFADRIPKSAEIIWLFNDNSFEVNFGWWGKYCVAIFLFISGFGYSLSNGKEDDYYLKKVLNIYKTVLFVFLIYIPLDIYFGVARVVSGLDLKNIIFNFIGFYANYNGEWWFLFPYVLMVLLTPLLQSLRNNCIILFVISIILHSIPSSNSIGNFLFWQTAYVIGFICGVHQDRIATVLPKNILGKIIGIIISCFILEWGMQIFSVEGMIFFVPFLVYVLKEVFNIIPTVLRKVIMEFGSKCQIMWLTHSFYCYHFAGDFIYMPRYSILILLNLLLISYASAFVISKLEDKLSFFFIEQLSKYRAR